MGAETISQGGIHNDVRLTPPPHTRRSLAKPDKSGPGGGEGSDLFGHPSVKKIVLTYFPLFLVYVRMFEFSGSGNVFAHVQGQVHVLVVIFD